MEQKTAREWFDLLPPILMNLALENTTEERLNTYVSSLSNSLDRAINWSETKQGGSFWMCLYSSVRTDNKIDQRICTTEKLNSLREDEVKVKDYFINYNRKQIIEFLKKKKKNSNRMASFLATNFKKTCY